MSWDNILYLSILGTATTAALVSWTTWLGARYRRELPKLPIIRSIEALELEREEIESAIDELQQEVRAAREGIRKGEEWGAWLEEKAEEIAAKKEELKRVDEEYRKLEEARQQRQDLEESARSLEGTLSQKEDELGTLQRKEAELQERLVGLEEMRQEHDELVRKLPAMKEQNEDLETSNQDLRDSIREAEEGIRRLLQEQAELSGTVQALRQDKDRLHEAIVGLKKSYKDAGGIPDGHDPCEDLFQPYFKGVKPSGGPDDENERLLSMEQQLDQAGIRLPRRALYAFHTALKIQDISPLTVLAGISGTGKSLLPAVYSKCMGLHFLNLPVQPSWNSPQDLFGFYNYMEHKYKATPLARALLQFTSYDRPDKVAPILEQQVLLVLLDEMNLARIEYYFSELLSRLELRRTIDPEIEEERIKVEIPLEIPLERGSKEEGRKTDVRIYPGSNVLFAGTMNEDESTLSLSDKVLDRATVLRFGKPTQLRTTQPDTQRLVAAPPLAYDVWRQWQSPTAPELPDEFKMRIDEHLAKIMADLGIPLGHRGAQGIARYLLLYPERGHRGLEHALADQIEQKVLPKVRGKEIGLIEGPMKRLADLAKEQLDDEPLANAIEKGMKEDQGIFLWNGLDRQRE